MRTSDLFLFFGLVAFLGCAGESAVCPEGSVASMGRCIAPDPGDTGLTDGGGSAGDEDGATSASDGGVRGSERDPAATSGTRLRVRYLEAGPSATMTVDLWDSELETPCTFAKAPDGTLRCLPSVAADVYYADSGCTEPVYQADLCDPGWARDREDGSFFRRTDEPAPAGDYLHSKAGGDCRRLGLTIEESDRIAERIPSARFVAATVSETPRAGGMVSRFAEGEDGSRMLLETVHASRGYTCEFDEDGRCVYASARASSVRYTDADCERAVYGFWGDSAPPVIAVADRDTRGCTTEHRYYELGDPYTASGTYLENADGGCEPRAPDSRYTYYELGDPIPRTTLPEATIVLEGEGPLRARRYVDSEGDVLATVNAFWEVARDEACLPGQRTTGDGYVCVPEERGVVEGTQFSSDDCAPSSVLGAAYCPSSAPRLLWAYEPRSCDVPSLQGVSAVYERGTEVGADYHFENPSVSCEARTFGDTTTAYTVGDDVVGTLPDLEIVVE